MLLNVSALLEKEILKENAQPKKETHHNKEKEVMLVDLLQVQLVENASVEKTINLLMENANKHKNKEDQKEEVALVVHTKNMIKLLKNVNALKVM